MSSRLLQTAAVLVLLNTAYVQAQAPTPSGAGASTKRPDSDEAGSSARALPLRLLLLDPTGMAAIPSSFSCQDTAEEAVNLQSLIQLNAASLRLMRGITLHSFSRWGCPGSAGAGAALTYAIEVSPKLALVLAGGVAAFPHVQNQRLVRPGVRADLQWTTKDGQPRSIGIDATQLVKSALKAGGQRRIGASISGSF